VSAVCAMAGDAAIPRNNSANTLITRQFIVVSSARHPGRSRGGSPGLSPCDVALARTQLQAICHACEPWKCRGLRSAPSRAQAVHYRFVESDSTNVESAAERRAEIRAYTPGFDPLHWEERCPTHSRRPS